MIKIIKPIALFSFLLFVTCSNPKKTDYASVSFFIGDVALNGESITIGDRVTENSIITTGKRSSCDIKIGSSIIRIKENSKMKFASLLRVDGTEKTRLNLEKGYLLCKPKKLLKGDKFVVQTSTAVAGVRGTQFTVQTDLKKTTRIKVYSGKVKVVKRVKSLDSEIDTVLARVKPLKESQKVVISENDAKEASTLVDKTRKKKLSVAAMAEELARDVKVDKDDISTFKVEDFKTENSEIIKVSVKPVEVINKIKVVLKSDRKKPKSLGRILVTNFEIFFIKDGKVDWEGEVKEEPLSHGNKIYIASGDYIFCASTDGPVIWRKKLENNGKLYIRDNLLEVETNNGVKKIDLKSGVERL